MHKTDPTLPPDNQDERIVVTIELGDVKIWLQDSLEEAKKLVRVWTVEAIDATQLRAECAELGLTERSSSAELSCSWVSDLWQAVRKALSPSVRGTALRGALRTSAFRPKRPATATYANG